MAERDSDTPGPVPALLEGALDRALAEGLEAAPSEGFDARFWARFEAERAETEQSADAALERALDLAYPADSDGPGSGFDARFDEALEAELRETSRLKAGHRRSGRARDRTQPRRARAPRRRTWALVGAFAAAALAVVWWPSRETPPTEDALQMMADLELLEAYDTLEVLDALEDEATFELVASLHELDVPGDTPSSVE
jgi:hypothetical protein